MICAENIPGLNVSYDTKNDRLTVDAKKVPLTQILAQISEQSGVEILVDPSVEKDISIYLPAQPLKKALKQIARGLNYAMYYNDEDSRLVAMKIVPKGKQGSSNLVPVTHPNALSGQPDRRGDGNYDEGNNDATRGRRIERLTEKGMGARQRNKIMQNEDPGPSDAASFLNK
jgi:type II secretory pathway component GspD/PulD (secretin)